MRAYLLILLSLTLAACGKPADTGTDAGSDTTGTDEDPYIWLEDVEGEEALAWVEEQNAESLGYLEALPTFEPLRTRNLEIYDSEDRIPGPGIRDEHVYNFWRDANNIRGVWRRMSIDDYVANKDDWEVVLDIDALAEAEDEDWVWKGSNCLRPAYTRCLINLSRGGADATVVREFDAEAGEFVENGFFLPEAKSSLSWVDEDTLFVGSDFGDGSLTDSGYPRTARLWKRGVPVEEAEEIFAGEQADVWAGVYRTWDGDTAYDFAQRVPTFFTRQQSLLTADGDLVKVDVPDDATIYGIFQGQMLVELKSDWTPAEAMLKQGSLVATDFARFMDGEREFAVLFEPTANTALKRGGVTTTRDYLMLNTMEDVVSKVSRLSFDDGEWKTEAVEVES